MACWLVTRFIQFTFAAIALSEKSSSSKIQYPASGVCGLASKLSSCHARATFPLFVDALLLSSESRRNPFPQSCPDPGTFVQVDVNRDNLANIKHLLSAPGCASSRSLSANFRNFRCTFIGLMLLALSFIVQFYLSSFFVHFPGKSVIFNPLEI